MISELALPPSRTDTCQSTGVMTLVSLKSNDPQLGTVPSFEDICQGCWLTRVRGEHWLHISKGACQWDFFFSFFLFLPSAKLFNLSSMPRGEGAEALQSWCTLLSQTLFPGEGEEKSLDNRDARWLCWLCQGGQDCTLATARSIFHGEPGSLHPAPAFS